MTHTELEWTPLSSSHVAAMAYNAADNELFVQYNNGSIYKFSAGQEEADGLRNASSPGRYMRLMMPKGDRIA